jgi:hypothetical protein
MRQIQLYGDAEGLTGVGMMISGLRPAPPASVAVDGIVASLYVDPMVVARPGIDTTTLLPNASMVARALAVGSQVPVMIDAPKEEAGGTVAPGRSCGGSVPFIGSALLASKVVLGAAASVVGHAVIVPMVLPEIWPKVPVLIVPSTVPGLAPAVGIVPGTAAGDVVGMPGGVERIAGASRVEVDPPCAKVELPPNKTMAAAVMRSKYRIGASCV